MFAGAMSSPQSLSQGWGVELSVAQTTCGRAAAQGIGPSWLLGREARPGRGASCVGGGAWPDAGEAPTLRGRSVRSAGGAEGRGTLASSSRWGPWRAGPAVR